MKCIYSEVLGSSPNPAVPFGMVVRAIILSEEEPESLEITGADVDGLGDEDIIAAGSVLITPDANYIAFEDGVFMAKGGSGGGGGGGSDGGALKVTFWYDLGEDMYVCDKTYDEIASAYEAGKYIWGFSDYNSTPTGNGEVLNLDSVDFSEGEMASVYVFTRVSVSQYDGVYCKTFVVSPNSVSHYETAYPSETIS